MGDPRSIIIRPIISEKSYDAIEGNKYSFEVCPDAKKSDVRCAVEEIFNVVVIKVNTMSVKGKLKRQGRTSGRTKNWKKAIVTLREGDRIEFFEGK
ncbi:50S ribosomal protein L23 [Candidatus Oleimmundimicrobium sp.]|uniref:50S ribosomal protein L23 n=1 Tax=Candidatus Oleimmundimicrobium sp. TaxID=3060597 RepID=UPI002721743F|nr:50S ribosomal protein L23 [Candidatus Oleimmundimicrobium sp.]MDO8886060.1 50S ribosomal protein L23 [Candidatus Oleimmundimicrobium sp.]